MQAAHILELAGQEGLEPPTCGFGDRRSTNWSYWPIACPTLITLSSLFVRRVMTAPLAVLLQLDAIRIVLLVLFGRVIAALAISAGQSDQRAHEFSSYRLRVELDNVIGIHMNSQGRGPPERTPRYW